MKSFGDQFIDIINRNASPDRMKHASAQVASGIEEGARGRSKSGTPLPNAQWDNTYGRTARKKKGRSSPVTLRDTKRSMREMSANKKGEIRGSRKLQYHDRGTAKGGKIRQLFPKMLSQFPTEWLHRMKRIVSKTLNGEI